MPLSIFALLLTSAICIPIALFLLLRVSLRSLFKGLVPIDGATEFYERLLLIGLLLSSLGATLDTSVSVTPESPAMEYVWDVARGLSDLFIAEATFAGVYLVLITVIVAALGQRRDG